MIVVENRDGEVKDLARLPEASWVPKPLGKEGGSSRSSNEWDRLDKILKGDITATGIRSVLTVTTSEDLEQGPFRSRDDHRGLDRTDGRGEPRHYTVNNRLHTELPVL